MATVATAETGVAQESNGGNPQGVATSILTLDQDRLFTESLFGKRLLETLEEQSAQLAARNRRITAELTLEEKDLTEKRKSLEPDEFRALADAFDAKVLQLRDEQDARIRELQTRRDTERRTFTARVLPILSDIVRESGAVAILDNRAVILAAEQIDITDRAINRIDHLLGDGGELIAPQIPPAPSDANGEAVAPTPDSLPEPAIGQDGQ